MSPERLWRLSSYLHHRGMRRLGRFVKRVSSFIYKNSLAPDVVVPPDIRFGHSCFGTVIHSNVTIGHNVRIGHHVTLSVSGASGGPHGIVIGDGVGIGAHAIVLAPRGRSLRIGDGAKIGAGALVVHDVPPGATVVGEPSRMRLATAEEDGAGVGIEEADAAAASADDGADDSGRTAAHGP